MRSGRDDTAALAVALLIHDGAVPPGALTLDGRILVVVRDPATNASHPNVVSVPTCRVPPQYVAALWPENGAVPDDAGEIVWRPRESESHRRRDPVVHEVVSLLSQKLGLGDALERGDVRFDAGAVAARTGLEADGSGALTMITVLVALTRGAERIPRRTASYSDIRWVPARRLAAAIDRRDPSVLGLSSIDFCIHGLCIASAYDLLAPSATAPFQG